MLVSGHACAQDVASLFPVGSDCQAGGPNIHSIHRKRQRPPGLGDHGGRFDLVRKPTTREGMQSHSGTIRALCQYLCPFTPGYPQGIVVRRWS